MVVSVVNMTTLPKKYEQELKDHRDSQNKDRLYQATLKEVNSNKPIELPVAFEVQELKMKHDNWLLDEQMKMIRRELITMINERKVE
mgnify:FL=1